MTTNNADLAINRDAIYRAAKLLQKLAKTSSAHPHAIPTYADRPAPQLVTIYQSATHVLLSWRDPGMRRAADLAIPIVRTVNPIPPFVVTVRDLARLTKPKKDEPIWTWIRVSPANDDSHPDDLIFTVDTDFHKLTIPACKAEIPASLTRPAVTARGLVGELYAAPVLKKDESNTVLLTADKLTIYSGYQLNTVTLDFTPEPDSAAPLTVTDADSFDKLARALKAGCEPGATLILGGLPDDNHKYPGLSAAFVAPDRSLFGQINTPAVYCRNDNPDIPTEPIASFELYPADLDLSCRRALIVDHGTIGLWPLEGTLQAGAANDTTDCNSVDTLHAADWSYTDPGTPIPTFPPTAFNASQIRAALKPLDKKAPVTISIVKLGNDARALELSQGNESSLMISATAQKALSELMGIPTA